MSRRSRISFSAEPGLSLGVRGCEGARVAWVADSPVLLFRLAQSCYLVTTVSCCVFLRRCR